MKAKISITGASVHQKEIYDDDLDAVCCMEVEGNKKIQVDREFMNYLLSNFDFTKPIVAEISICPQ